ncbi:MAG: DMT family transporter [Pleomorphochaeta sp.]
MNNYVKGVLVTSFASILFGLNPLFVNYLQGSDINLYWTLIIRFGGSFLIFLITVKKRKLNTKLNLEILDQFKIFMCAVFFLLTSVFLVYSYSRIPSGLTTVLHFIYPIIITIFSVKAKRNSFNLALAISIIFSIFGVYLVTNPSSMVFDFRGISSAFLSALTISIYLFILNDKKIKKIDNNIFVYYVNFYAIILLLISSFFMKNHFLKIQDINFGLTSILGIVGYIFASAYGGSLFSYGSRIVGGPIAGTLGAFEPLTAVFVGLLFLGEHGSKLYFFGVLCILASTVITSIFGSKKRN